MPVYRGGPPAIRRQPVAAAPARISRSFDAALAFVAGIECAGSARVGVGRRARVGHDADRGAGLAAARTHRPCRRSGAGGLRDLPNGLLRLAVSRHRAGQGRLGSQVVTRVPVPGQLQQPLSAVGARHPAGRSGSGGDGDSWPPVVDPPLGCAGSRMACAHGAKPAGGGGIHACQRSAAGDLLDPPGRRLHARPGVVDAVVLHAGTGRGNSVGVARRHPNGPRRRLSVRRRHERVVAGGGGLVAVGGEFERHGVRRHPRHLHRHRRRATVLRAGHRQRASTDGCRLSRLPANACGADGVEQHARRRAAAAVRQLRPVGRGARHPAAPRMRPRTIKAQRARTQCFSPISACWG